MKEVDRTIAIYVAATALAAAIWYEGARVVCYVINHT